VAEQPNDGANEDGLTGTWEADYAENLAGHEIKGYTVQRAIRRHKPLQRISKRRRVGRNKRADG
jgi:hypothetical protein